MDFYFLKLTVKMQVFLEELKSSRFSCIYQKASQWTTKSPTREGREEGKRERSSQIEGTVPQKSDNCMFWEFDIRVKEECWIRSERRERQGKSLGLRRLAQF
jgi:hypothetical protein